MQKGGEGVQIACKIVYVINGMPLISEKIYPILSLGLKVEGFVFILTISKVPTVIYNPVDTITTDDNEILTRNVTRPGVKFMSISCLYWPPRGKYLSCIKFLVFAPTVE